jgi:hypothetical protein
MNDCLDLLQGGGCGYALEERKIGERGDAVRRRGRGAEQAVLAPFDRQVVALEAEKAAVLAARGLAQWLDDGLAVMASRML